MRNFKVTPKSNFPVVLEKTAYFPEPIEMRRQWAKLLLDNELENARSSAAYWREQYLELFALYTTLRTSWASSIRDRDLI